MADGDIGSRSTPPPPRLDRNSRGAPRLTPQSSDLVPVLDTKAMGEEPAAKRPKIRLACQECRDRKIRCDGGRPLCGSCSRKKLGLSECVYAEPGSEASADYVRSLEGRIRELENSIPRSGAPSHGVRGRNFPLYSPESAAGVLRGVRYGAAPSSATLSSPGRSHHLPRTYEVQDEPGPSDILQMGQTRRCTSQSAVCGSKPGGLPLVDANRSDGGAAVDSPEKGAMGTEGLVEESIGVGKGSSVYLGRSSAAAFMSEIRVDGQKRRQVEGELRGAVEYERNTGESPGQAKSFSRSMEISRGLSDLMEQLVLPPRLVADRYLENYWKYFYPYNPILHRRTFQRQ